MTAQTIRAFDESGRTLDDPTDAQVHDLFADLNASSSFAIVERLDREPAGQHYFQTRIEYVDDEHVDYDVEYRDGSKDRHFHARVDGRTFSGQLLVHRAYVAWRAEDPGLRDVLPWHRLDLDS